MPGPEADGPSSPLDAALRTLSDDQRRRDAVEGRRHEQWLKRQAGEEGTFAGVLVDLGERGGPVVLETGAGRAVRGVVERLGDDFVGLRGDRGQRSLVPLDAVTSLRAERRSRPSVGDRASASDASGPTLDLALARLGADRPDVVVHTWSGSRVAGMLVGVGRDVVVVRDASGEATYVPIAAINDLTVV